MTSDELKSHLNRVFGITEEWPETYEVDPTTYANCCQAVFNDYRLKIEGSTLQPETKALLRSRISIDVGVHCGLMFKNVELILKP